LIRKDIAMDTAVQSTLHRPETVAQVTGPVSPEVCAGLTVTVIYLLSEAGRKASLMAGGNGRELQQITVHVPASRLHLVSVDAQGIARLKLRPWYAMNADQRIIRTDALPTYDKPPDIEELFRAAAKNHELERAYETERTATRSRRRETQREQRRACAEAFLSDPAQRALVYPAPSPKRCVLVTEQGRVAFHTATDEGLARDVPPEAHRRFRADLRARREHNLQERAMQLALHDEKKRYLAAWVALHGTAEQQARHAAGVLPMDEAVESITDQVFAALSDRPRYARDGAERLQAHLRQFPLYAHAVVTAADLLITGTNAVKSTASQWRTLQKIQAAIPDATVVLRLHKLTWKRDSSAPPLTLVGILATTKTGPFTLRREYDALACCDEPHQAVSTNA
jgi:hypothetical protein